MSLSGFDLNLVRRAGAARRGLMVVVGADTVCASCGDALPTLQTRPVADMDSMEGCPPRPPACDRSGYGQSWLGEPMGARLDLLC